MVWREVWCSAEQYPQRLPRVFKCRVTVQLNSVNRLGVPSTKASAKMSSKFKSQHHQETFTALAGVGILQRKCDCGQHTIAGAGCSGCNKEREAAIQRSAISHQSISDHDKSVPPLVNEVLRSSGQSLDADTRAFMEPRFGHDFSHVRVHTDSRAAESASAVNAQAYTVGQDIVFGSEQYAPKTSNGQRLLAHELAHVVQQ